MISCYLQGGLGNQLFQVSTSISYGLKHKKKAVFLNQEYLTIPPIGTNASKSTPRKTYWNSFLSSLKRRYVRDELPAMMTLKEKQFHYYDIGPPIYENRMLVGYFQSYKYFEENKDLLYYIYGIDRNKEVVKNKFDPTNAIHFENCISIHFRIGDYINLQDFHPILDEQYYNNALKTLLKIDESFFTDIAIKDMKILYFYEEKDKDMVDIKINVLKKQFPNNEFIAIDNRLDDWEQLLVMSLCKYNIIANSTFSWWAAYFNTNPDRKICYPSLWFGELKQHLVTTDLFLPEWIKIDVM